MLERFNVTVVEKTMAAAYLLSGWIGVMDLQVVLHHMQLYACRQRLLISFHANSTAITIIYWRPMPLCL